MKSLAYLNPGRKELTLSIQRLTLRSKRSGLMVFLRIESACKEGVEHDASQLADVGVRGIAPTRADSVAHSVQMSWTPTRRIAVVV